MYSQLLKYEKTSNYFTIDESVNNKSVEMQLEIC